MQEWRWVPARVATVNAGWSLFTEPYMDAHLSSLINLLLIIEKTKQNENLQNNTRFFCLI